MADKERDQILADESAARLTSLQTEGDAPEMDARATHLRGATATVTTAALERILEQLAAIDLIQAELCAVVELGQRRMARLRDLRTRLVELPQLVVDGSEADFNARVEELARGIGAFATTAARGIGAVRRAAGQLRAASREVQGELTGRGIASAGWLDLPLDATLLQVIWVRVETFDFAFPSQFVRAVAPAAPDVPQVLLAELLHLLPTHPPTTTLEVLVPGMPALALGVDHVGDIDRVLVHAVPDAVQQAGPFSGAVRAADGTLHLVLDPRALVMRASALGARE